MVKIVVIGGGISGLAVSWYLEQFAHAEVTILEKEKRLGGWIQTDHSDGLFECGPRSIRSYGSGKTTLELLHDLGLDSAILHASDDAKERFLLLDGKLKKVPSSFRDLLASPWTWQYIPPLFFEWAAPPSYQEDETIASFFTRRLGKKITRTFIDPLVTGIYAGDLSTLSIRSCFPSLFEMEKEHGSLTKGMFRKRGGERGVIFSLQKGLEQLIFQLVEKIRAEICLNINVLGLDPVNKQIEVETNLGKISCDHLVFAVPAPSLGRLFPPVSSHCASIPLRSVTVVHLGYSGDVLRHKGFGYLIPSSEKEEILGAVWDSSVFPAQNRREQETRISVMMSGEYQGDPQTAAINAMKNHLEIHEEPTKVATFFAKDAIPQYGVGHDQVVAAIERELQSTSPHLHLLGNSFYGVAVNDCIEKAKSLALKISQMEPTVCNN